jgi:hypothetical protein
MNKSNIDCNYKESESHFSIDLGGDENVDASTLTAVLNNFVDMLKFTCSHSEPNSYIKLNITKTEISSFNIDVSAIMQVAQTIFNENSLQIAEHVVCITLGYLQIKQHLDGEKPREISYCDNTGIIVNQENKKLEVDKQSVENYFSGSYLDNCTVNIFNALDNDQHRDSLGVRASDTSKIPSFKIQKKEFERMKRKIVDELPETEIKPPPSKIDTIVKIVSPVYEGLGQWKIRFEGKIIKASISDEKWLKQFQANHVFAPPQSYLEVVMLKHIILDKDENLTKEPVYEITEVKKVQTPEDLQPKLFSLTEG